jgi:hypothetical protein
VEQGEKLSRIILYLIRILYFDINVVRAACGKMLNIFEAEAHLSETFSLYLKENTSPLQISIG